jgi:hypothetical protein
MNDGELVLGRSSAGSAGGATGRRRLSGAQPLALALVASLGLMACGIAVRSDRAAIGGGPEQATAQAQARIRATAIAVATANPIVPVSAAECDCSSAK